MEKYILDRFEENFAVLVAKSGKSVDVEKHLLPDCKEGDVVVFEDGIYRADKGLTEERQKSIQEKLKRLFNKG